MLHKCANSSCRAQFRYLNQGRLFELKSNTLRVLPAINANVAMTKGRSCGAGSAISARQATLCDLTQGAAW